MAKQRTCTVDGCTNSRPYRLYCTKHYYQIKKLGKILPEYLKCNAPGCDRSPRSLHAKYCEKHYYRLRRNGALELKVKRVPNVNCKVEGCGNKAFTVDGACRNCSIRFKRNGDYERHVKEKHPRWLPDDKVTYKAIHQRLRERIGKASTLSCVDCSGQAMHWSYNHGCDNEKHELHYDGVSIVPFCAHIEHYSPRCVSCHKEFDLHHLNKEGSELG